MGKTFTLAEVKARVEGDDKAVWVVIHDKVYDVTNFLEEHPGGGEVLQKNAGVDATDEFEDAEHSKDAVELMKQYYIGDLDTADCKSEPSAASKDAYVWLISTAIGVGVVGIGAIVLYRFYGAK